MTRTAVEPTDVRTIGPKIAAELGNGWIFEPSSDDPEDHCCKRWGHLVNEAEEAGICLHVEQANRSDVRDRLRVSGVWPSRKTCDDPRYNNREVICPRTYGHDLHPKITVSTGKTPATLAADIRRRFMPDYLAQLAIQKQRRDDADAYHTSTRSRVNGLAALAGAAGKVSADGSKIDIALGTGDGLESITLASSSDGSFRVEGCSYLTSRIAELIAVEALRINQEAETKGGA